MNDGELDQLLAGISVYQDVVIDGRVVRRGQRDCEARWALIEPDLPAAGVLLDVGSNFGWFGLRAAATRPGMIVLSAEADERSARVQQALLAAHDAARIALVTRRAGTSMLQRLAATEQRFDAVLCLSILHWMPDHREFTRALAKHAARIFFEYPDPRETGVGLQRIRDEIGDFETYLRSIFNRHEIRHLGETAGLAANDSPRSLWLVTARDISALRLSAPRLDAEAVLSLVPAWPQRAWWQQELAGLRERNEFADDWRGRVAMTPHGLAVATCSNPPDAIARLELLLARVPQGELFTRGERLLRRSRYLGGALRDRLSALGRRLSFSR